jgi:hypothetical protein
VTGQQVADQESDLGEDARHEPPEAGAAHFLVRLAQALDEAERSRLMKTTLERALADFNALTEGGASLKDTWPRMARLLEVRPELAKPLARKLVTGEVPPGSTAGIFVALGTPTCRRPGTRCWRSTAIPPGT